MRKLKVFALSLVAFSLLANVCASDLGNLKSEVENFVGIIAPQDNENVFVDQVVQEFKVLFDDISAELETKLNKLTVELEQKSGSKLEEKAALILEGKFLLELKDSFLNAFNPILNVENYKDHHKRELKDSIEKFNEALENIANDNFINNIFDKDGSLAKQLPTQDALLAKMQKLNASLYAILLEGKKLNEKRLDDILDVYYRMLLYTKNNKLKVGTITAVSVLAVIGAIYLLKNRHSDTPDAPDTDAPDTDAPDTPDTPEADKPVTLGDVFPETLKEGEILTVVLDGKEEVVELNITTGEDAPEEDELKMEEEPESDSEEPGDGEYSEEQKEAAGLIQRIYRGFLGRKKATERRAEGAPEVVGDVPVDLETSEPVAVKKVILNVPESEQSDITFDDLGVNRGVISKLSDAGIDTAGDLLNTKEENLLRIRGIGQKTIDSIKNALHSIWKTQNPEIAAEFEEVDSRGAVDEGESDGGGSRLTRTRTMVETMKTVEPVPSSEAYRYDEDHGVRKRKEDQ